MKLRGAIDRREVLRGLGGVLGLSGASLALPAGVRVWGSAKEAPGRTLILLQLSGGNDGLSTVVPHGDDAYFEARQATRIESQEVLRLDEYRGLHPELIGLHELFGAGKLALVEGVGYPEPNRSHFKALDIWHAASRQGRRAGIGWVGRLMQALNGDRFDPHHVVHVGEKLPYSLFSNEHPPIAFALPRAYRWAENEADVEEALESSPASEEGNLSFLRDVARDALQSSRAIRSAVARYESRAEYPKERLAERLRVAAALVNSGIGAQVISVEFDGFDTHNEQRRGHDRLMRILDGSLSAFLADLEETQAGRKAVCLVFSEFGRRVKENGSRGTDHGAAAPVFVAGAEVKGGLHGAHPSLTELHRGDLAFTTDFRRVYATLIEGCFAVPGAEVLGKSYPTLPLL